MKKFFILLTALLVTTSAFSQQIYNTLRVKDLFNTGTATFNTSYSGVAKLTSGVLSASTIVNADISASAAIAYSKFASMATGQVLLGNAGVPTATTLSGGITVGATGVVTLGNSAVITQLLTGYASSPGTVSSADSIVQAIQKIDGNDKLKLGLTKSDSDVSTVTTTQLNVPNSQLTTSGTNTRRIETGNDNLLKNPSFEATTVGSDWTAVNGSCSSSSGVTVDGLKNCLFTSSGTNWSLSQCSTINAPRLAGQEMENSVWLGSASTTDPIWVCPGTNGSYPTPSVANGCMQYTNIGNIQPIKNYFLGDSASASNCIRISGSNSGTTVGIDKAYTGLRTTSEVSGEINTPWVPCTFSTLAWQGLGTVSNFLECKRSGPTLKIRGSFTAGTVSANIAQMPLPTNYGSITTSSTVVGGQTYGTLFRAVAANSTFINTVAGPNLSYISFSGNVVSSAINPAVAVNGNGFIGTGEVALITGELTIPINEWKNNINAFSLKCDDPRQCETVFSFRATSGGVVSDQTFGTSFPHISGNCTISNTSTYTCPFVAGVFTTPPICNVLPSNTSSDAINVSPYVRVATTTSNFTYRLVNASSAAASAQAAEIICQRQGVDAERARITQQIVQMRGVPTVPGSVRSSIGSSKYYGSTLGTSCTVTPCQNLKPVGKMISSVGWTGTFYRVTLDRAYNKVSCSINAVIFGTGYTAAETYGENVSQLDFSTAYGTAPGVQSAGTVNCIGEY